MLALAFLHPALLWALPLAAVPIIIHILNRRRFQKVPWAAMTFLLRAMKRNRKRMRMEQWLVLLLRVLVVLLLVALVSRPQLGGGGLLGSVTHHVVVLDDSASMQQKSGSSDLFSRGQDRVRMLADDLAQRRAGDLFSIVRTTQAGEPDVWARPIDSGFGATAGTALKELSVSDSAPSAGLALGTIVKRAHEVEKASRTEYYLVGDTRSWDWATPEDKARPKLMAALASMRKDREHVTVLSVGGQHDNIGIADVRLLDRLVIASVPASFGVDVKNFGLDPTAPTTLSVVVDGQSSVKLDVPQLAPGERATLPMGYTFHEAGAHRLDASLEASEAFRFDDRRSLALQVREKSRVLLVDGEPDVDDGETFFLQTAFDVEESGMEAQVVTETGFEETNLEPFGLIWWCNVQAPSERAAKRLTEFVANGGGLVIALGSQVDAGRYNELLWQNGEGVLPLPIGDIDGDSDRPEPGLLVGRDHAICSGFGDMFAMLFADVLLVKRWLTLEEPEGHDASIVARIHDAEGPPLLATRTYQGTAGEVGLLAITADTFWSNMPVGYLLVPLAHQLHAFGARRDDPARSNRLTEGVFEMELDPGLYRPDVTLRSLNGEDQQTFTAEAPLPEVAAAGSASEPSAGEPSAADPDAATMLQLRVPLRELRDLGAYELELRRHDGVPEPRILARNAPLDESRLVSFDEAAFKRLYPGNLHDLMTFVRDETGIGSASGEGEAWPLLASLLLVGLLLESLLAWRFGRR
ncbi:MAG: BatA domain-containing protein [Planctomycetota bacterium]